MNTRRQFLEGAMASFFIGGCATKVAPRKIAANAKVNVAIIGCGHIARFCNLPGFFRDPRCRVTVVCDMVRKAPNYYYGGGSLKLKKTTDGFPYEFCGSQVLKAIVDSHYGDRSCREVFD